MEDRQRGPRSQKMVGAIQDRLIAELRHWAEETTATYLNAYGAFVDPHTITATKKNGKVETITSDKFIIAVGGRPSYLDVSAAKVLHHRRRFSLWRRRRQDSVRRCLLHLPRDRGLPHRARVRHDGGDPLFCAASTRRLRRRLWVTWSATAPRSSRPQPSKFEKLENGKIKVTVKNTVFGSEFDQEFDTVVLAVGRYAVTEGINLLPPASSSTPRTERSPASTQSNVPHIYAVGDVLDTRQELTPVAIKVYALVNRIFATAEKMDYDLVPTTVFTPLEYGCIGMSEELAIETYGEENVEVYQSYFKPLEWTVNHEEHDGVAHREDNACYSKLITNLADGERVVGFHYVGPNAGEVTQGYAVAMKMGATKSDFDNTVGIHPTVSEEFTLLSITKRSGIDASKKGC